jgi:hypothetical protein
MICEILEEISFFNIIFKKIFMTNVELIKTIQKPFLQEGREQIRTGMEVEIHQIIKEDANGKEGGKERVQKYK